MANIDITLTFLNGDVFSDIPVLTVFNGDTFSVTSSGGAAMLVFSPDLTAAVSPQPQEPVTLADGQTTAFTFTSSDPGGYFIAYGPAGADLETEFPPELSNALHLQGPAVAIAPPPPPPIPVAGGVSAPPKGGASPTLNPQGAD
jgi:hypothetical protein